jgi:ribokinase
MSHAPALVIAGNLLVDDIVLPDGRTLMGEPGGAVLYATLGAALWEVPVAAVSLRGTDYPDAALAALAERGVDLAGVHATAGPNLRTWLLYEPHGRRVLHRLGTPDHERVSPTLDHFPAASLRARAVHLAPTPLAIQGPLARALRARRPDLHLSLDPFEIVRPDRLGVWPDALAPVDTWFVSEDDVESAPDSDPAELLARAPDARFAGRVVLRLGARGGRVLELRDGPREVSAWAPWAPRVVDATGAGDAFAGGWLAGRLNDLSLEQCAAMGVVSASFALADWGPRGLLAATPDEARRRLAVLRDALPLG